MPYESRLTVFVVLCVFLGAAFLFLFLYRPVKHLLFKKNPTRAFYSKVMKVAKYHDFYLINDLKLNLSGSDYVHIDHILAGDRYIYVITDCYLDGALSAKPEDPLWVYYKRGGKKESIPNGLKANRVAMERLSIVTGIDSSFLVGIVLVNDDCFVTPFDNVEGEPVLTPVGNLEKLVMTYEKKEVKPFVQEELQQAILDLHEMSEKAHSETR
jgi:hypothetical protein